MKKMTLASFPKGAVLVNEKDPGDTFFLIVSGSAKLFKKSPKMNGDQEETVAFVSRGDALGELSLLTNEPYPYTARIESTADVLILKKQDFDEILESHPKLAVHVTRQLSSHLASIHRGDNGQATPGRLLSVIAAIPFRDQALFSINLGISLVEQTRQKTLLFFVDDGNHVAAKSLGLNPSTLHRIWFKMAAFAITINLKNASMFTPAVSRFSVFHQK